jgi:hypothetical protein
VLSSPDRDDDLLRERLRELHDVWPGTPADDDPLRDARLAAGITGRGDEPAAPRRSPLRRACRAILDRLGASATGLPLAPAARPSASAPAPAEADADGRTASPDPRDRR